MIFSILLSARTWITRTILVPVPLSCHLTSQTTFPHLYALLTVRMAASSGIRMQVETSFSKVSLTTVDGLRLETLDKVE